MKKMRRFLSFLLAAVMSIGLLAGCSNDDKETDKGTTAAKKGSYTAVNDGGVKASTVSKSDLLCNLDINTSTKGLDSSYDISELLYGLFLEDINYCVDGGLYAEMVKNRSFEYGQYAISGNKNGWVESDKNQVEWEVVDGTSDKSGLNANNMQYAILTNKSDEIHGIGNSGFQDGPSIEKGKEYVFTGFFKNIDNYKGKVTITVEDAMKNIIAQGEIDTVKDEWWKYEVAMKATDTKNTGVKIYVKIGKGKIAMDMISLFPKDTYGGRENGLRKDIVQYLKEVQPKFLRFPGGCIIEGTSEEIVYDWKNSIGNGMEFKINGETTYGDVSTRIMNYNLWGPLDANANPYYMTYGCGFYEYFLLCEDIDALAMPILNAGMTCELRGDTYVVHKVGSEEFEKYVQDALDLVEFCRGDASTKWGKVRIGMGHEEPFELKYIGIGNEQSRPEYFAHFEQFKKAFDEAAKKDPVLFKDIELVVANGPTAGNQEAWNKVKQKGKDYAGLVDEHYYMPPSWYLSNVNRYDSYDRESTPVFLGEYAAQANNLRAALAEAAYMTGIERNSDIVKLACYAPLFGSEAAKNWQWKPDMIWFNNDMVYGSVNYYVQKMFSTNQGATLLKTELKQPENNQSLSGKVGVGTWMTSAEFDDIKVVSNVNGSTLYNSDFTDSKADDWKFQTGRFQVKDGKLVQSNTGSPKNETIGDVAYVGLEEWSDYTYTFTAKKTGGSEGFLIPIAVQGTDNNIFWNLGGWGNTVSCLQIVSDGGKSDQVEGTVSNINLVQGKEYKIKIVMSDNQITCYLNDKKMIDYTYQSQESVFQVTSADKNGDVIVKMVNVSGEDAKMDITLSDIENLDKTAYLQILSGDNPLAFNSKATPENLVTTESTMEIDASFSYTLPKYSVVIMRIAKK